MPPPWGGAAGCCGKGHRHRRGVGAGAEVDGVALMVWVECGRQAPWADADARQLGLVAVPRNGVGAGLLVLRAWCRLVPGSLPGCRHGCGLRRLAGSGVAGGPDPVAVGVARPDPPVGVGAAAARHTEGRVGQQGVPVVPLPGDLVSRYAVVPGVVPGDHHGVAGCLGHHPCGCRRDRAPGVVVGECGNQHSSQAGGAQRRRQQYEGRGSCSLSQHGGGLLLTVLCGSGLFPIYHRGLTLRLSFPGGAPGLVAGLPSPCPAFSRPGIPQLPCFIPIPVCLPASRCLSSSRMSRTISASSRSTVYCSTVCGLSRPPWAPVG